jgi:hypothetical protein
MNKKIKQILVDGVGYLYAEKYLADGIHFANIISHEVNGDMAKIIYYYCLDNDGNVMTDINGRFVVAVDYETNYKTKESNKEMLLRVQAEIKNIKLDEGIQ